MKKEAVEVGQFEMFEKIEWVGGTEPKGVGSLGFYHATTAVGAALDYLLDVGPKAVSEVWAQGVDGPTTLERFAVDQRDDGYFVKELGGPERFATEIEGKLAAAHARIGGRFGQYLNRGEGYKPRGNKPLDNIVPPPGGSTAIGPDTYFCVDLGSVYEPHLRTEEEVRDHVENSLGLPPESLRGRCKTVLLTAGPKEYRGRWMVTRNADGVLVNPHNGEISLLHKGTNPREWKIVKDSDANLERAKLAFNKGV